MTARLLNARKRMRNRRPAAADAAQPARRVTIPSLCVMLSVSAGSEVGPTHTDIFIRGFGAVATDMTSTSWG